MARPSNNVQLREDFTASKAARIHEERRQRQLARERRKAQHEEMLELAGAMHQDRVAEMYRQHTRESWIKQGYITPASQPVSLRAERIRAFAISLDVLLADKKPMDLEEELAFGASFKVFEPLFDEESDRLS